MNMTKSWLCGVLGLALLGSSCATTAEVRGIVTESNAVLERLALLRGTELPGLSTGENIATADQKARAEVLTRIDAFIAEHKDKRGIVNALYIR